MNQFVAPHCFQAASDIIVKHLLARDRRLLLFGQPGIGKTTLATGLATHLSAQGRSVWCLSADPGLPAFGAPGAICLGRWQQTGWSLQQLEALCSLDAARFRLPLISVVKRLANRVPDGTLIVDAPGVIRGVAGAELLAALTEAARIDLLLVLTRPDQPAPLANELASLGVELAEVNASDEARRPGGTRRARYRTKLWDSYLAAAAEQVVSLQGLHTLGTPPRNAPAAWLGKQVAFLEHGRTLAMGEVTAATAASISIRCAVAARPTSVLLVRDACRGADGLLSTGKPFASKLVRYIPPPDLLPDTLIPENTGMRPLVDIGSATAVLVNGVFGDPLLHLRLRNQRRSLLFDLGDGLRLPARIAHQVSDVFITHAHIDHISGFLALLRSRIGEHSVCRLYGPPGLASNIECLIGGIHWDRIGSRGPSFDVFELHGDRLRGYRLQAGGTGRQLRHEAEIEDGLLLQEATFSVRAVTLDHRTPVLAFSYLPAKQFNVRKARLLERQLEPGPWLNTLKSRLHAGNEKAVVSLPDGSRQRVDELAAELILTTPGSKLVYATDFADTPDNRHRLRRLAQQAHTLFCESTFLQQESEQAQRTGHLTTRACGEIANEAQVQYLIPFHFSRRYEEQPWRVYQEIAAICPQLVMPKNIM